MVDVGETETYSEVAQMKGILIVKQLMGFDHAPFWPKGDDDLFCNFVHFEINFMHVISAEIKNKYHIYAEILMKH